ncbi:uncharacterized protein [Atheta coriaria]|uniref:uncharacterized protein isoform X2 n=1 Tax=Dalotia coriaria TaxID=877792 RepID=UPI0031F401CD
MSTFNLTSGYYKYLRASSEGEEFNDDPIQGLLNDTDSELSNLSHVDAPNESLYMIGGVLIAMFLVGVIIILLAVTISKLRKREEHSNSVHPTDVVLHQTTTPPPQPQQPPQATQQTTIQNNLLSVVANGHSADQPPASNQNNGDSVAFRAPYALWQYPPQPQPLYNNTQDVNVQNLSSERPGLVRGFRKNLGGRWRRLVKKKPETEAYTIPAELRPQLKQIYVY